MCTGITESALIMGSGKGSKGWFKLNQVNVSYDHPYDAQLDHALNIDFVNTNQGVNARIAVELSPDSAKRLIEAILTALSQGNALGETRISAAARNERASLTIASLRP